MNEQDKRTTSSPRPVLIVGAGPTGMTAAMELSCLGVLVRIVDKLLSPSTTSRALAVQTRTLELFEQRGLIQEMLRIGNKGTAATIYGDGKRLGKVHRERCDFVRSDFNSQLQSYILNKNSYLAAMPAAGYAYAPLNR